MQSPVIPVTLFAVLVSSIIAAIPLSAAGSGALAIAALGVFVLALAGLAWWVVCADHAADPRKDMMRAAERFDSRWDRFERDFWAYVDAVEAESEAETL